MAFRDSAPCRWTIAPGGSVAEGERRLRLQLCGWAAGDRFGPAVHEAQPDALHGRLEGDAVLKGYACGKPSAEVGYRTAAHRRTRSRPASGPEQARCA
ncbi:hypothetical protein GCM10009540_19760 [Streptomyces turgidiscabies]